MGDVRTFPCDKEGMIGAQAFLESFCDSPKPAIVVDEIVSNIVRCSGSKDFSIALEQTADGLVMTFTDSGQAFDPTQEVAEPDLTSSVDDRQIGGLGIFMVKKMAKSVSYRRTDDQNVLTVVM